MPHDFGPPGNLVGKLGNVDGRRQPAPFSAPGFCTRYFDNLLVDA
jgi:hypothetical protein